MRIEKKCWPEFFEKILSGEKSFDARIADFDAAPGDVLVLKEWNPETGEFSGRVLEKEISFVLNTNDQRFWSNDEISENGIIIMSLR